MHFERFCFSLVKDHVFVPEFQPGIAAFSSKRAHKDTSCHMCELGVNFVVKYFSMNAISDVCAPHLSGLCLLVRLDLKVFAKSEF